MKTAALANSVEAWLRWGDDGCGGRTTWIYRWGWCLCLIRWWCRLMETVMAMWHVALLLASGVDKTRRCCDLRWLAKSITLLKSGGGWALVSFGFWVVVRLDCGNGVDTVWKCWRYATPYFFSYNISIFFWIRSICSMIRAYCSSQRIIKNSKELVWESVMTLVGDGQLGSDTNLLCEWFDKHRTR